MLGEFRLLQSPKNFETRGRECFGGKNNKITSVYGSMPVESAGGTQDSSAENNSCFLRTRSADERTCSIAVIISAVRYQLSHSQLCSITTSVTTRINLLDIALAVIRTSLPRGGPHDFSGKGE